jgi:hypothetical protein
MQFDIYKYTRATLMSVGTLGSALSTIVMPLSANINDNLKGSAVFGDR